MNLIALKQTNQDDFIQVVECFRSKAALNLPTLEKIIEEVETVRKERYARNKA